jgi:ERCC4-type nuclease
MIIKIDNRESELINQIKILIQNIPNFKDLEIIIESLPLGDAIICNPNSKEDILIIERKTVNDLSSSIKDGRYEEQSFRLNGLNLHNHNIIYLIEGDVNRFNRFKDNKTEKLTLYSAIFSLNYYKGFSVIRTYSIDESAIFICNSANKLRKGMSENKKPYYQKNYIHENDENTNKNNIQEGQEGGNISIEDGEVTEKDYVSVVKKVKKENITPDNIGEIMLCQIPGVSAVTAITIMKKFGTLPNLILSLQNDENCLKDISYTNSKDQVRKISKTSIQNIIKFLLKK